MTAKDKRVGNRIRHLKGKRFLTPLVLSLDTFGAFSDTFGAFSMISLGCCGRYAQLVVAGETISRWHCRILTIDDVVFIEDLNSRNGTWLNGTRIQRAPLVNGAVVHLGLEQFVFERSLASLFLSTFRPAQCGHHS